MQAAPSVTDVHRDDDAPGRGALERLAHAEVLEVLAQRDEDEPVRSRGRMLLTTASIIGMPWTGMSGFGSV